MKIVSILYNFQNIKWNLYVKHIFQVILILIDENVIAQNIKK